jgi:hypothetical protein
MPEDKPQHVDDEGPEDDDGCYWKLIPLDDWSEAMNEVERCGKTGIKIRMSRINDENGKEYLSIAKRVPIGK